MARAREHTDDVEFSPQDATRTPLDFMIEVLQAAVDAGATTLNIPDTVGYGIPWDFGALIQYVRREVKGDYVTSTHCHNDLGLAVANSLAGMQAGARQVEVLRQRPGRAGRQRRPRRGGDGPQDPRPTSSTGMETGVRTEELARTSRLVSRLTGYPIQYNKAVVGRNAFAHESGIHQHGVLAERTTYEIIDAASRGPDRPRRSCWASTPAGTPSPTPLQKMGLTIHGDALNAAFTRFKELADRKVEITDADLEAIVAEELGTSVEQAFALEALEVAGGTVAVPRARVVLSRGGEKLEASAEGDGMIDAACQAIRAATGVDGRLTDFNVSSVTGGVDALGDVIIQLEADGVKVSGRGVSTDVVEASARAYLNAVNRVMRVRARNEERAKEIGP